MDFNVINNNNYNKSTQMNFDFKKHKGFFKALGIIVLAVIALAILFSAFTFTVDEREQVVVKQFGEVVKVILDDDTGELEESIRNNPALKDIGIVKGKGLFFKIPFINTTESFTNMILTYDTYPREVTTKDKKKLLLDNYAQWRISNPALFLSTIQNKNLAHQRLDELIYSKLNEEIGKVDAHIVISDKDYVNNMSLSVTQSTNEQIKEYGMEVVDIRIKRTDLPIENYSNVFNRMKTERERAAKTYRSEGQEEAQVIRSTAEKEATILEAQAYEQAEKIRGEGDAEALRIYAEAYNKDPEFYAFWRTLQVYRETLDGKTKIVIDPDSEFAKYLYSSK